MKIRNGFSLRPPSPEVSATERDKKLRAAAQMYENYFLNQMVKAMRKTVPKDSLLPPSMGDRIYKQELDQQYVDGWTKQGGIGIADLIYNQLKDNYYSRTHLPLPHPHGLPIQGAKQFKVLPEHAKDALHYRFELPPSAAAGVQAPLAGKVAEAMPLGNGWSTVSLDHGGGLRSRLTFPGRLDEIALGEDVRPGQKLGELDPGRPVLDWRLAWNLDSDISV